MLLQVLVAAAAASAQLRAAEEQRAALAVAPDGGLFHDEEGRELWTPYKRSPGSEQAALVDRRRPEALDYNSGLLRLARELISHEDLKVPKKETLHNVMDLSRAHAAHRGATAHGLTTKISNMLDGVMSGTVTNGGVGMRTPSADAYTVTVCASPSADSTVFGEGGAQASAVKCSRPMGFEAADLVTATKWLEKRQNPALHLLARIMGDEEDAGHAPRTKEFLFLDPAANAGGKVCVLFEPNAAVAQIESLYPGQASLHKLDVLLLDPEDFLDMFLDGGAHFSAIALNKDRMGREVGQYKTALVLSHGGDLTVAARGDAKSRKLADHMPPSHIDLPDPYLSLNQPPGTSAALQAGVDEEKAPHHWQQTGRHTERQPARPHWSEHESEERHPLHGEEPRDRDKGLESGGSPEEPRRGPGRQAPEGRGPEGEARERARGRHESKDPEEDAEHRREFEDRARRRAAADKGDPKSATAVDPRTGEISPQRIQAQKDAAAEREKERRQAEEEAREDRQYQEYLQQKRKREEEENQEGEYGKSEKEEKRRRHERDMLGLDPRGTDDEPHYHHIPNEIRRPRHWTEHVYEEDPAKVRAREKERQDAQAQLRDDAGDTDEVGSDVPPGQRPYAEEDSEPPSQRGSRD